MDEAGFRRFLEGEILPNGDRYTRPSINARLSRARRVERVLGVNLDEVVNSEERTINARNFLYQQLNRADDYYNALTRYFKFRNGYEIPPIKWF